MGILLVRHAEAIPEQSGLNDAERWLTGRGRAQAREVGALLVEKKLPLTRFIASPRMRAVQTAELVAQGLGFMGSVECLPALSYTVPAEQAARELADLGGDFAAFGHMPTIAEIAGRLASGEPKNGLSLCEALWIEGGRVVWSVKPR